jgi:hypothetical protein
VVVHTILMVPLGQATEPKPPPLLSSSTGTTPSRGISVTGWTQWNLWWRGSDGSRAGCMSSSTCRRRYPGPLTHRPACCTASATTSASTLMLKSCKDLSLGDRSFDYVWAISLIPFHSQFFQLSLASYFAGCHHLLHVS